MQSAHNVAPEAAVADVLATVPRLMAVTAVTAISFALFDGANRTIAREKRATADAREIASGYRGDCSLMAVLRLVLLLDRDPKMVSFQRVHRHLKRPEVVAVLAKKKAGAQVAARDFLAVHKRIDWEVHGRLAHFRNTGVAHLTPHEIKRRITYRELRKFVLLATRMAECLAPLASDMPPFYPDQIAEYSERSAAVWRTAFRAEHKARLKRIAK